MTQISGASYVQPNAVLYGVNNLEDAPVMYIGKAKADGTWLVQRYTVASGDMVWANMSSNPAITNYTDAWTARAALVYGLFETLTGV
jgi:hypothetical protein